MSYSQVEEISGPSIKIDRRREEPREVRVVGISVEKKVFYKAKKSYRYRI